MQNPFDLKEEVAVVIGATGVLGGAQAGSFVTGTDLCVDGGYMAQTI